MVRNRRRAVAVALVVVVAVSGFVAPVAAERQPSDDRGRDGHGRDDRGDEHRRSDDEGNSSLVVHLAVHGPGGGGSGGFDCEGTPSRHECDKGGSLNAGPIGADYAGNNSANVTGRSGGGGDTFTVRVRDHSATVGFDCTMTEETVRNASACDGGASTA